VKQEEAIEWVEHWIPKLEKTFEEKSAFLESAYSQVNRWTRRLLVAMRMQQLESDKTARLNQDIIGTFIQMQVNPEVNEAEIDGIKLKVIERGVDENDNKYVLIENLDVLYGSMARRLEIVLEEVKKEFELQVERSYIDLTEEQLEYLEVAEGWMPQIETYLESGHIGLMYGCISVNRNLSELLDSIY